MLYEVITYSAFDLHSNNSYLGVIDETGKRIAKKKMFTEPQLILDSLFPHQNDLAGVVIESTYNWYWMADLLLEHGYKVHLANRITSYNVCYTKLLRSRQ